ncbi:RNA recognition motif protein, putative [Ichthyophthirius multifiliis]|uniref:RNA recognition motif protein, putative n=1 Tax=Ichthyophthirius multifiliis TaxID=5932 RepID=G0QK35_ICHMU|nr:RNA recognition motif protein, putative [Ichthyophthirius multifiliis]EGR34417.1 RNA recognition motif protein, putative [Ichthyophthirius multifiliis]|eukprot:XP_004039721.1 RNA recognition motif protein, putative [Ichthyophthirius multifiliis]
MCWDCYDEYYEEDPYCPACQAELQSDYEEETPPKKVVPKRVSPGPSINNINNNNIINGNSGNNQKKYNNSYNNYSYGELQKVRVIKKNLVYVIGLSPEISNQDTLMKKEYFGQYGKITKIVVNTSKAYNPQGPNGPSYSAYITFQSEKEASMAILGIEEYCINDRIIRASYGTTKYCVQFLKQQECPNLQDCLYLHQFENDKDCFCKDDQISNKNIFIDQQRLAIKNIQKYVPDLIKLRAQPTTYTPVLPSPQMVIEKLIEQDVIDLTITNQVPQTLTQQQQQSQQPQQTQQPQQQEEDSKQYLYDIYNIDYLIYLMDKEKINIIKQKFDQFDKKGVDIVEFLRILLNSFELKNQEILYFSLAVIDLFKEISEKRGLPQFIVFSDLTEYICDYFVDKNITTYLLPTVKMPEQKKYKLQNQQIRHIDINPSKIYGKNEEGIRSLLPNTLITNSQKNNNYNIIMGYYSEDLKRIIILNSLTNYISIYTLNCKLAQKISLTNSKEKDSIIMAFAYSEQQQRIGACLKDVSLAFWDKQGDFQSQKNFSISNFTTEYQINIWYLPSYKYWITTDKQNCINIWDIDNEKLYQQLKPQNIQDTIINIIEISHLRLVAVGSSDKKITIWNFKKFIQILQIPLNPQGIHHIVYNYHFQCILTCGYENSISIFKINPQFFDFDEIGKLIGHSSMVTSFQIIPENPMVVSSDDNGIIKIWDIRSLKCLQTIEIMTKSSITNILYIESKNSLCFLNARLNIMKFDECKTKNTEEFYPIKIDYNSYKKHIIISTRKDLRFLDIKTGKIHKIFTGLLSDPDTEISSFSPFNQFQQFILGDQKGLLSLHNISNGEIVQNLNSHMQDVSHIKIDHLNKLIISSSFDSSILLQKQTTTQNFELQRSIINANFKKQITLLEFSVFHNIFLTSSQGDNRIYVYDYEYFKLISIIQLQENTEPTSFSFINGYQILLISTNFSKIYILKFQLKSFKISYQILDEITVEKKIINEDYFQYKTPRPSFSQKQTKINQLEKTITKLTLFLSTNLGKVLVYTPSPSFFTQPHLPSSAQSSKPNYNAFRNTFEDFFHQIKSFCFVENTFQIPNSTQDPLFTLSNSFHAHKESLTCFQFIELDHKYILTSSIDQYIRIFTKKGELKASLNINHPVPIFWEIQEENTNNLRTKLFYTLKILKILHQKNILQNQTSFSYFQKIYKKIPAVYNKILRKSKK